MKPAQGQDVGDCAAGSVARGGRRGIGCHIHNTRGFKVRRVTWRGTTPWSGAEEDPLSNENLLKIVLSQTPDVEVNRLVWDALGYTKSVDLDMDTLEARAYTRSLFCST